METSRAPPALQVQAEEVEGDASGDQCCCLGGRQSETRGNSASVHYGRVGEKSVGFFPEDSGVPEPGGKRKDQDEDHEMFSLRLQNRNN